MFTALKTVSGDEFIVDVGDLPAVVDRRWYSLRNNTANGETDVVGVIAKIGRKTILLHRVLMNPPDGMVVDHINGNPLDNRRENLRICTQQENTRNRRPKRTSELGIKGVSRVGKRFKAEIYLNGKNKYLGLFDTPVEAGAAYAKAAAIHFGSFARSH